MKKLQRITAFLLAAALAVTMFGCGGSSDAVSGSGTGESGEEISQIVLPIIADPGTMNPLNAKSTAEVVMARVFFNGLCRYDPETYEPAPSLAERWETSEDGLTWTFYLRQDVKWHDGEPFTAEDVKFSMDTFLSPEFLGARYLGEVESTEVVDDYTVKFHMSNPFPAFASYMINRFMIAPKHLLEGTDIANNTAFNKEMPIGTGAYKMVEYIPGEQIVCEANPDYFLGAPKIDRVIFKVLPDSNTQIAQLKTGELDLVSIEAFNLPSIENDENIDILSFMNSKWYALHLNNNFPLFQDKTVRQAIAYAIDRDLLVQSVLQGHGIPAASPIIPNLEWAFADDIEPYPYDPEKSKELLAQAGWTDTDGDGILDKDGEKFSFTLQVIKGNPTVEQTCTILQQEFKDIGMDVQMQSYEFATWVTEVRDARSGENMSQAWVCWMTPEAEPDGNFAYFHSSNAETGSNFTSYKSAEADKALEEGRYGLTQEERKEAYHRFQEIIHEDVARDFLFYPETLVAVNSRLKGVQLASLYMYMEQWYLE